MQMKFPDTFPMNPPELRFVSDFWHPNVYKETGVVCISILHSPGELVLRISLIETELDETSGERADERWRPTQTVATILLSVISLLSAPNFFLSGETWMHRWSGGRTQSSFGKKISKLVEKSLKEKPADLVIPHPDSNPEVPPHTVASNYLRRGRSKWPSTKHRVNPQILMNFMHDDNVYAEDGDDQDDGSSAGEASESTDEERKNEKPTASAQSPSDKTKKPKTKIKRRHQHTKRWSEEEKMSNYVILHQRLF